MEVIKDKNIYSGIDRACKRSKKYQKSILFSYTIHFDVRDVLPLLTHPSDKNNYRLFWTQPSSGFAFDMSKGIWLPPIKIIFESLLANSD